MSIRTGLASLICVLLIGCTGRAGGLRSRSDDALVAPGDLLLIVTDFDIPTHTADEHLLRVDEDGMVCLWMVNRIPVAGHEVSDLGRVIGHAYREEMVEGTIRAEVWRVERADNASVKPGRISPGDNLMINLWGLKSPAGKTTDYRHVDASGIVTLTEVGDVELIGLTESEAVLAILDVARARGIAQDLRATVRRIPEWAVSSQNAR